MKNRFFLYLSSVFLQSEHHIASNQSRGNVLNTKMENKLKEDEERASGLESEFYRYGKMSFDENKGFSFCEFYFLSSIPANGCCRR